MLNVRHLMATSRFSPVRIGFGLLFCTLVTACAFGPADPNEHYVLTDTALFSSNLRMLDVRSEAERTRTPIEGGYSIGDGAVSPAPRDFLKSELSRLVSNDPELKCAREALETRELSLTKFRVSLQRQDLTAQTNTKAAPGVAAGDYALRGITGRFFAHRQIVVEVDVEINGERFTSGRVTWTTDIVPYSNAAIFPASYATRLLLIQICTRYPAKPAS